MVRALECVAVLRAAHDAGLVQALLTPASAQEHAARLALPPARVEGVLGVLEAHGVAERTDAGWALVEAWADIAGGQTPVALTHVLGFARVREAQLAASLQPGPAAPASR